MTTEIIRNAFISAAQEMSANLARSAYTPHIYEMKDCSVGLFDRDTNLLGQAAGLPIFLGNLAEAIRVTVAKYGLGDLREGDVYVLNDSYLTGTHLGDMTVISPIFLSGDLVGFAATRAHWLDVGGKDPLASMDSTEIYQEGIRLGPTRVYRGGEPIKDILDILALNTRFPRSVMGDLHAQIAACRTGEARLRSIIEKFGRDTVSSAAEAVFEQCESLDREAIRAVPDGVYEAEGTLDSDGHSDDPVLVRVKITVSGSDMTVDLTGSSPQVAGSINCGLAQTISGCRVAFKFLVNPELPVTGGTFRPLTVIVPPGSIFAAREPAACQFYFSPLGLLIDLIVKALEPVLPHRVAAAHFGDSMLVKISGSAGGVPYVHGEAVAGGWGAGSVHDGESALVNSVNGDMKNLPVEYLEAKLPLLVRRYSLVPDSAGGGRYRGGFGLCREYEIVGEQALVSLWFERSKTPAWGLHGGHDGRRPAVTVRPAGGGEMSLLKVNSLPVPGGSIVEAHTGGGGGYGSPLDRPVTDVWEDVMDGLVSIQAAREVYGVVIDPASLEVDEAATERARGSR